MFVTDDFLLDLNFPVARARLAEMAYGGSLASASQRAHGDGLADMVRAGPQDAALAISKLVAVRGRELVTRDGSAVLSLRWEAAGPAGCSRPWRPTLRLPPSASTPPGFRWRASTTHRPLAPAQNSTGRFCTRWRQ